jgi:microcystin-dependent protein
MPRDGSGNYQFPANTQAVAGQLIDAAKWNSRTGDMGSALTGSLSRDGAGSMTGPLGLANGSLGTLSARFAGSTSTGIFYDPARSAIAIVVNGTEVASFTPGGFVGGGGVEIGSVFAFAGGLIPPGYVWCNGEAFSRSAFSTLFARIGTAYGPGDGSTTFNVPDLRGRTMVGLDILGGTMGDANRLTPVGTGRNTLGGAFGTAEHTLTIPQMPGHGHPGSVTDSAGAHTHDYVDTTLPLGAVGPGFGGNFNITPVNKTTTSAGAHTHGVVVAIEGGGQPHLNVQPSIAMNFIIRAL